MQNRMIIVAVLMLALTLCICGCSKDELTYEEQLELGMKYLEEGNYEGAVLAFEAAIRIDPKQVEPYIELASVYVQQEDYDSAWDTLSAGINNVAEDFLDRLFEKAYEVVMKARSTGISLSDIPSWVKDILQDKLSEQVSEQVSDPEYYEFFELGISELRVLAVKDRDYEKCSEYLFKALGYANNDKDRSAAYFLLADCFYNDAEEAIGFLQKIIDIDSTNDQKSAAYAFIASLNASEYNDSDAALEYCNMALECAESGEAMADVYYTMGNIYYKYFKDTDKAISYYEIAAGYAESDWLKRDCYDSMCELYYDLDLEDKAEEAYQQRQKYERNEFGWLDTYLMILT